MSGEGEVAVGVAAVAAAPAALALAAAAAVTATAAAAAVTVAATATAAAVGGVVGAGAALLGTGAGALKALQDCGAAAVMATKAVGDALGDCVSEIRDLSFAQAAKAQKAYEALKDQLENMDQARQDAARQGLLSVADEKALGVSKEELGKCALGTLADASSLAYHLNKTESLLYQMEQEGLDVEAERARMEELRDQGRGLLKKGKSTGEVDSRAMELIKDIGERLAKEKLQSAALEACQKEVVVLERHIADPYLGAFESDLLDLMNAQEKPDEAEQELQRLRSLVIGFAIKARTVEAVSSASYEDMARYIKAVREKMEDDVHISEKIRFVEELLPVIESRYKDVLADNKELLEAKATYDQYHIAIGSLMAELGEGVPEYAFNPSDPSASLAAAKVLLEQKGALKEKRDRQEAIHAAIARSMRQRRWSAVANETFEDGEKRFLRTTYHVENGNVIQFTIDEEGHMSYGISGVVTPGVAINRRSIYETQVKVCAQREALLREIADACQAPVDEEYRDEPNLAATYEIPLTGVIPGAQANLVEAKRNYANRGGGEGEAKHRHVEDDE